MAPPIKTTIDDIDTLFAYLKAQVGWVPLDRARKTIDSKFVDNRKLEASRYLGLIDRDGTNLKLSETGKRFASADGSQRASVMRNAIASVPLYMQTIEWIHHGKHDEPNKTDVGNYWHDKQQDALDGAKDAALTDAVVFFFRVADVAGLGKFVSAGKGRPVTFLRSDLPAIEEFVTGPTLDAGGTSEATSPPPARAHPEPPPSPSLPPQPTTSVVTSPAVHINIEIHIAANASASTVEEIFKNMRKYVLTDGD